MNCTASMKGLWEEMEEEERGRLLHLVPHLRRRRRPRRLLVALMALLVAGMALLLLLPTPLWQSLYKKDGLLV